MTAAFSYHNTDSRTSAAAALLDGLAQPGHAFTGGLLRPRGKDKRTLGMVATADNRTEIGDYELDADLQLQRQDRGLAQTGRCVRPFACAVAKKCEPAPWRGVPFQQTLVSANLPSEADSGFPNL